MKWIGIAVAIVVAVAIFGLGIGSAGADDRSASQYQRQLEHRDAHRYPMTSGQHRALHNDLAHDRYDDRIQHTQWRRGYGAYRDYGAYRGGPWYGYNYPRYRSFYYGYPSYYSPNYYGYYPGYSYPNYGYRYGYYRPGAYLNFRW